MKRSEAAREFQRRLTTIVPANGYVTNVVMVERNPDKEPPTDRMPYAAIWDFGEASEEIRKRRTTDQPLYEKNLKLAVEIWVVDSNSGAAFIKLEQFMKDVRTALFIDGMTLGGLVTYLEELELTRVHKPKSQQSIAGVGMIYGLRYIEDFANL